MRLSVRTVPSSRSGYGWFPSDAANLAAAGLPVPQPVSVLGLVDTGAEVTAIQRSLAEWMGIPTLHFLEARSSVLGYEARVVTRSSNTNDFRLSRGTGPAEVADYQRARRKRCLARCNRPDRTRPAGDVPLHL